MSRIACAVFVLLCFVPSFAQRPRDTTPNPYPPQAMEEMKKVQQAALASDYAYQIAAHLTDNIGPRMAGSAQARQAVEYIAAEMRKLGLEVTLEKCTVPHWVRGAETAELVEFPGQAPNTTQKIVVTALGGSVATPAEGITAEVVVVNNFDELNALGREKVQGRIVLFNAKFDKRLAEAGLAGQAYGQAVVYRGRGASAAARLGAVASLIRSVGGADYRLPHTGVMSYAADAPKIPGGAVTAEDADLIEYLARQGRVGMRLTLTPQGLPPVESYNVIGDLKGSEHPEQVVIVSGHLDSWDLGTGAIDDAAGVAVAMQAAQVMKQLGLKPKRTLRVVAWMDEEGGLLGARSYVKWHAADIPNHFAAVESDLGAGHAMGIAFAGPPQIQSLLRPVASVLQSSGAGALRASEDVGSDIGHLTAAGVPSFSPIQDSRTYFDYHHTAADTLDKIVPRELQENAAVMSVLGYALTNLPVELPRLAPRTPRD
ncbi:MAG: M20/M25/M40 family metallo-hydrolase [Acidobacteriia bacterium]|nr:M20/M25/M40 family metallo-hydrolase [Terriglobia bacterium]